jgi:hypothetical protein
MHLAPEVQTRARPPAPLSCSLAETNNRVTPVCQFAEQFFLAQDRLLPVAKRSGVRHLFSAVVRSRNCWNVQSIALLAVCSAAATSQRLSRVIADFLRTSLALGLSCFRSMHSFRRTHEALRCRDCYITKVLVTFRQITDNDSGFSAETAAMSD